MSFIKDGNLALRFLLELCVLAALGYWGFTREVGRVSKIAIGLGAPLVVAAIWAIYIAPKSDRVLQDPTRLAVEIAIFGAAAYALVAADRPRLAIGLVVLFVVNRGLMAVWNQ